MPKMALSPSRTPNSDMADRESVKSRFLLMDVDSRKIPEGAKNR